MALVLHAKRAKLYMDTSTSTSSRNVTINDLPSEILLEVFTYLDHEHLHSSVSRVCERWKTLHSDPSLYRRLTFTECQPSTEVALKLISNARWLKSLQLINRKDTNKILQQVGISDHNLETLVLRDCRGTPLMMSVSSDSLLGVLHQCNLLQQLSLKGTHSQCGEVYKEIGLRLPKLRSVDFGSPPHFHSEVMLNVANNCRKVEEIRAFAFEDNNWDQITNNVVSSISNKFSDYLQIVKIDFCKCTDASLQSLAKCTKLKTLNLYNAHLITDFGIMYISDMPHILKLTMTSANLISAKGWVAYFQKPMIKKLTKLSLIMCDSVNDRVAIMIAKKSRDLRELRLVGNVNVTEPGHVQVLLQLPSRCVYIY